MLRSHTIVPFITAALVSVGLVAVVVSVPRIAAQVMESSNYQIERDSVNVGGARATSSSYVLDDTAGDVATGYGTSTNYTLHAGYQQLDAPTLSLTGASVVTMSPAIGGISGGTANGSTTVTAMTDSPAGYQLTIRASSTPAMQSATHTIGDYAPAGAAPDFAFTTGAGDAHFGFSPEGDDVPDHFRDNGSDTCGTGSSDTALACWDGLATNSATVAQRATPNQPTGTETALRFRVGIGSAAAQAEGTYVATTTLTLIAL
jgi:hypothetical protein